MKRWRCGHRWLDLSQPRIMGVLNVTPDSFSDGGRFLHQKQALEHAGEMLEQGADIIDIGGESTRPGAAEVSVEAEIKRVLPVLEALRKTYPDACLSIDTSKPEVLQAATEYAVDIINDVRALQQPGMLAAAAASDCGICLMHMQGQPRSMQQAPVYNDVISDVADFLTQRVRACTDAGIGSERLVLDPGFGFGKTLAHNTKLLAQLALLQARLKQSCRIEPPMLVGISRKSMLAAVLAEYTGTDSQAFPPAQRIVAGTVAAALAVLQGASIVRTHDVAAVRDGLAVVTAVQAASDNDHSQH